MSETTLPLVIILGTIVVSTAIGLIAGSRVKMTLDQWAVGGRSFGLVLLWLLMAGEIYTTFTYLGAAGWAYGQGAPVLYIPIEGALAYILAYFFLPPLWRVARRLELITQPDFFVACYDSQWLGVFVAVIGIIFMIPYLQLQIIGLGLIVELASYGEISANWAMIISFGLTAAFVYVSGMRGSAWLSVVKDIMMLVLVIALGILLPLHYFGGPAGVMHHMIANKPHYLILPGAFPAHNVPWFLSTVVLTTAGFYMWPHYLQASYSSRDALTLKRNAVLMPIYQVLFFFLILVGFTALLVLPPVKNPDTALLSLVRHTYPPWVLGLAGAGGALAAMVPASLLLNGASTLFSRNVYQAILRPSASSDEVERLARGAVLVLAMIAVFFAIATPGQLVNLLLIGYDGVAQFFVGVIFGLAWKRVSRAGVFSGLIGGEGLVAVLLLSHHDPLWGLNAGLVALVANVLITVIVSLAFPSPVRPYDRVQNALQPAEKADETVVERGAVLTQH